MAKNNLKARIKYYEEYNNFCKDGYALEIFTDGEWSLSTFYPCKRSEGQTENCEAEFVHYTLLNEIKRCLELGYKVEFLGLTIKY